MACFQNGDRHSVVPGQVQGCGQTKVPAPNYTNFDIQIIHKTRSDERAGCRFPIGWDGARKFIHIPIVGAGKLPLRR